MRSAEGCRRLLLPVLLAVAPALAQSVDSEQATLQAGKDVVDLLGRQDFTRLVKRFDLLLKMSLPVESLRAQWNAVVWQLGPYQPSTV